MSDRKTGAQTVVLRPPAAPKGRVGSQRVYVRAPGSRIYAGKIINPRGGRSMKLKGAAKAKFLARMAAGRRKAARTSGIRRGLPATHFLITAPPGYFPPGSAKRVGQAARRRRRPTARMFAAGMASRANPRKRRSSMARLARNRKGQFVKRSRNPSAYVANPRKKRRKKAHRKAPARTKARRTAKKRPGRTYPLHVVDARGRPAGTFRKPNPRRRRRARNPSFGGVMATIKTTIPPMLLGGAAGLGAGYIDAKFLGDKPTISLVSKLTLALLGAAMIGRKHPMAAAGFAGGMMGSTGYRYGVKFGGGLVGLSPSGTLKGLADMAAENPEMAATIAGLGDIVESPALGDGDATEEYNQALADSDEEMADIVEAD